MFRRWIGRIARRPFVAFVLLGVFFLLFSISSLNLIYIFKANIELILEHGWWALMNGAARQFIELLGLGYLSAAFFVAFKVCEKLLVERLSEHD